MTYDRHAEPPTFSGGVMRRARGVWLADVTNHDTGDQEFDAFPTEAAARRWVRDYMGDDVRVVWTQMEGGWTRVEGFAPDAEEGGDE